jgi:hypothetical protein
MSYNSPFHQNEDFDDFYENDEINEGGSEEGKKKCHGFGKI